MATLVSFNIARAGYSIRAAAPIDTRAIRMLLPEVRDVAQAIVAVDGWHELVVGAAATTRVPRLRPLVGPAVALHVIEPCRRIGIASVMLVELTRAAVAGGAHALYAVKRVEQDSREMQAWKKLGFTECESVREHMLPLDEFEPRLGPILDRMRAQSRIPAGASIIQLYKADLGAVLQLHLDHMGGNRGDLSRKLRSEGPGAFHPRYSRVLVIDGAVKGCILAHRADKETAIVDANILDPSVRGGWANIWLKLAATRGALSLGIKNFQFTTFDLYADTRSFTGKLGGETVRTSVLMYRAL